MRAAGGHEGIVTGEAQAQTLLLLGAVAGWAGGAEQNGPRGGVYLQHTCWGWLK